jgi:hypothetical protein
MNSYSFFENSLNKDNIVDRFLKYDGIDTMLNHQRQILILQVIVRFYEDYSSDYSEFTKFMNNNKKILTIILLKLLYKLQYNLFDNNFDKNNFFLVSKHPHYKICNMRSNMICNQVKYVF